MRVLIPLAGPDFELEDGSTRAERIVFGKPLLRLALESRSWWQGDNGTTASDLVFILRDRPASRRFGETILVGWFPGCRTIFLGDFTGGAAYTVLAGLAFGDGDGPICIDLADILFTDSADPVRAFREDSSLGGLLLTFPSSNPAYSYARCGDAGRVLQTAEKRVISDHASAGVYFFRDALTLLRAIAHSIENKATLACNGLLYACPLFNGVIAHGKTVRISPVSDVHDIKVA
jgi:hypothetical protein